MQGQVNCQANRYRISEYRQFPEARVSTPVIVSWNRFPRLTPLCARVSADQGRLPAHGCWATGM